MKHLFLGLALMGLFLLAQSSTHAAPKPLAILPGGGLVFKPLQSMRERRFANLVQQQTDFSCGAAAMATLLNEAYGWNFGEEQVIEGMLAGADPQLVQQMGFSMLDMKLCRVTGTQGARLPAATCAAGRGQGTVHRVAGCTGVQTLCSDAGEQ